ncbi:hypothetical protein, partial [Rhodococcus pyridinivorans]|uniref:hypothetical protein n=1 Tax=Rhodococcus pyridinivorans TaxID=103816 RepID=UPI001B801BF4
MRRRRRLHQEPPVAKHRRDPLTERFGHLDATDLGRLPPQRTPMGENPRDVALQQEAPQLRRHVPVV